MSLTPISNFDLKFYNTFGIAEPADCLVQIQKEEDLQALLENKSGFPQPWRVLGGGSNILLSGPVPGTVIRNELQGLRRVAEDDDSVVLEAGGGVVWQRLVEEAVAMGLGGLENLALIPGTVGASPIQNIGAYGAETRDTLEYVDFLDWNTGTTTRMSNADCQFGYRDSVFKNELFGKGIITHVAFRLSKKPVLKLDYGAIRQELEGIAKPGINDVMQSVIRIRQSKLPDPAVLGNAGSFFKNPEIGAEEGETLKSRFPTLPTYPVGPNRVKLAAGWLIEQCGWKGKRLGGVGVHERQALVLVNYGGGTGVEVLQLATAIQKSVLDQFGVAMEMEVRIWPG